MTKLEYTSFCVAWGRRLAFIDGTEQNCSNRDFNKALSEVLNRYGSNGWELISVAPFKSGMDDFLYTFIRQEK